jgi:hypothetical protein
MSSKNLMLLGLDLTVSETEDSVIENKAADNEKCNDFRISGIKLLHNFVFCMLTLLLIVIYSTFQSMMPIDRAPTAAALSLGV